MLQSALADRTGTALVAQTLDAQDGRDGAFARYQDGADNLILNVLGEGLREWPEDTHNSV